MVKIVFNLSNTWRVIVLLPWGFSVRVAINYSLFCIRNLLNHLASDTLPSSSSIATLPLHLKWVVYVSNFWRLTTLRYFSSQGWHQHSSLSFLVVSSSTWPVSGMALMICSLWWMLIRISPHVRILKHYQIFNTVHVAFTLLHCINLVLPHWEAYISTLISHYHLLAIEPLLSINFGSITEWTISMGSSPILEGRLPVDLCSPSGIHAKNDEFYTSYILIGHAYRPYLV